VPLAARQYFFAESASFLKPNSGILKFSKSQVLEWTEVYFPSWGLTTRVAGEAPGFAEVNARSCFRAFAFFRFTYLRIYVFAFLRFCVVFHASGGSLRWGVGLYFLDETLR
jgi:hypothetical protein